MMPATPKIKTTFRASDFSYHFPVENPVTQQRQMYEGLSGALTQDFVHEHGLILSWSVTVLRQCRHDRHYRMEAHTATNCPLNRVSFHKHDVTARNLQTDEHHFAYWAHSRLSSVHGYCCVRGYYESKNQFYSTRRTRCVFSVLPNVLPNQGGTISFPSSIYCLRCCDQRCCKKNCPATHDEVMPDLPNYEHFTA